MKRASRSPLVVVAAMVAALLPVGAADAAVDQGSGCSDLGATVECEFWAEFGSITVDGNAVSIAGYATTSGGAPELPGPTIVADEGDTVQVTLHNNLSQNTAMTFQGQALVPDLSGVAPSASTVYSFGASQPGTYSYGAGLLSTSAAQSAMGLYGALVVRPAAAPTQAYGDTGTSFDVEHVLVLSEIDIDLNQGNMATFDMRSFKPEYYLINGQVAPDVTTLAANAGDTMLLRYVNGGVMAHSMGMLGLTQTVVGADGNPLTHPRTMVAETLGSGQSQDVLVSIPVGAGGLYPVYDTGLWLTNRSGSELGGMMTFVEVTPGTPGSDLTGPAISNVEYASSVITATANDAATGGSTIVGAEYFIDSIGSAGTGTPMIASDLAFDEATEDVTATVTATELATLNTGSHTLFVRAQDSAGNWGAVSSLFTNAADSGAPVTTGLLLVPAVSNGTVDVLLRATGDDSASGGANVVGGEFFFDSLGLPGAGFPMSPNIAGPVVALDTVIPSATVDALSEGDHNVLVRSSDGQWGSAVVVVISVDKTGPSTTGVGVTPSPNDGTQGINSTVAAVRVTATIDDPSGVRAGEGFIDTVGADGTGFSLFPSDGVFNASNEGAQADVPLATIAALSEGDHTIYVHGKDAAGNWGVTSTATLTVDKTAPSVAGLTLVPNPADGTVPVSLMATATDASTSVVAAEWFVGTDPGTGNATAMTVSGSGTFSLAASIDTALLSVGANTVSVRARDAAGNWSPVANTILAFEPPVPPAWYFSTQGNASIPGVAGPFDNADIYSHDGTAFGRLWDASLNGVPGAGNLDGISVVDGDTFYVTFNTDVTLPGVGAVQDEDVALFDAGTWSIYFDGTARGLTAAGQDVDSIEVVGGTLYFGTVGNASVPGVAGPYDNADIYSWNGTSFSRVWDATANGVPVAAAIDGLSLVDGTHFYLSFVNNTTLPTVGAVQDEDVVRFDAGAWSLFFDGTAAGLTTNGHDIDAIDIP